MRDKKKVGITGFPTTINLSCFSVPRERKKEGRREGEGGKGREEKEGRGREKEGEEEKRKRRREGEKERREGKREKGKRERRVTSGVPKVFLPEIDSFRTKKNRLFQADS